MHPNVRNALAAAGFIALAIAPLPLVLVAPGWGVVALVVYTIPYGLLAVGTLRGPSRSGWRFVAAGSWALALASLAGDHHLRVAGFVVWGGLAAWAARAEDRVRPRLVARLFALGLGVALLVAAWRALGSDGGAAAYVAMPGGALVLFAIFSRTLDASPA